MTGQMNLPSTVVRWSDQQQCIVSNLNGWRSRCIVGFLVPEHVRVYTI